MLTAVQKRLDEFCFVLASASPRRLKLLEELAGFNNRITVLPSKFSENLDPEAYSGPVDYAIATSLEKAVEVAGRYSGTFSDRHIIISADTVIECDRRVLGKPDDAVDAHAMLRLLSGRHHFVHTGVTLGLFDASLLEKYNGRGVVKALSIKTGLNNNKVFQTITFSESTRVNFCQLDDDVIAGYVATGEGLDKAGSYGIQALGSTLVESIEGDFYNVVGLPLTRLCQEIYCILREKK